MRKSLSAALAAITVAGSTAAAALPTPALADHYRYRYGRHHHGNDAAAAAVVAGIAGLAIGAAIANSHPRDPYYRSYGYSRPYYAGYYGQPYYGSGYYAPYGYGGGYGYGRSCVREVWRWDPRYGREVLERRRYC